MNLFLFRSLYLFPTIIFLIGTAFIDRVDAWPTEDEYKAAVKDSMNSFQDDRLRFGTFETVRGRGGKFFPRMLIGAAAGVFLTEEHALRCFTQGDIAPIQLRLTGIEDYMKAIKTQVTANNLTTQLHLDWYVHNEFLMEGIKVRSAQDGRETWYPAVLMERVYGDNLGDYIAQTAPRIPTELRGIAQQWRQIMNTTGTLSIAHGDLQYGNIFVSNGLLRFIDADSMYVPTFGTKIPISANKGADDFVHPKRNLYFGPNLDHFTDLLIYVTLLSFSYDPSLINDAKDGVLFRIGDLIHPRQSAIFPYLQTRASIPDPLKMAVAHLSYYAEEAFERVPSLGDYIARGNPALIGLEPHPTASGGFLPTGSTRLKTPVRRPTPSAVK